MSEKDKQKKKASAEETAAQETAEQTAAPAEEAVQEETFTVTKSQMEQMEQLAKVLADANDKYLRLAAEYDNYRKRTTREKGKCVRYGQSRHHQAVFGGAGQSGAGRAAV